MPPTTITNISVVNVSVSEARLKIGIEWDPPQYTNGPLTQYEIWISEIILDPTDPTGAHSIYTNTTTVSTVTVTSTS